MTVAEITVEPYGGKPTETIRVVGIPPEVDKEVAKHAEYLGMTYDEVVIKLIKDGLKEDTVAQRIVEKIEQEIEHYQKQYQECWGLKGKENTAMCYLKNRYTWETVLKVVKEVIDGIC